MLFNELKDIHTHQAGRPDALLSLPPEEAMAGYDMPYSLELHPWKLVEESADQIIRFPDHQIIRLSDHQIIQLSDHQSSKISSFLAAAEALKDDPNLMAIGECGLDNKCQTPLPLQIEAFRIALQIAKEKHLPVIIHCVGYWSEMMQCVRETFPSSNGEGAGVRILHGFRKGPQLAQQLLNAGFSISLGKYYNPETKAIIPHDRLYWESD